MAERQGFEPWVPFGTRVLQTRALDQTMRPLQNSSRTLFKDFHSLAERGGFEPPVPFGTTAFEAVPINQTLASLP